MSDFTNSTLTAFSDGLALAAERALRSVVTVWAGNRPISGTVVGDGLVLTVEHVLSSDTVMVHTEDTQLEGHVAGRDPSSDLALLRVANLNAPALPEGPAPRLGAFVLAAARPGPSPMVSSGVVSGLGRLGGRRAVRGGEWLLTDASPFPGFSGSALVNASGALVGLVNAGVSRGEIVAVPTARALEVARALAERGTLPRGYLGVATQAVRLPGGEAGLLVMGVEDASPAAAGGVLLGDVLRSWNGENVAQAETLLERVTLAAGQAVQLGVLRGGVPVTLSVTVGTRER